MYKVVVFSSKYSSYSYFKNIEFKGDEVVCTNECKHSLKNVNFPINRYDNLSNDLSGVEYYDYVINTDVDYISFPKDSVFYESFDEKERLKNDLVDFINIKIKEINTEVNKYKNRYLKLESIFGRFAKYSLSFKRYKNLSDKLELMNLIPIDADFDTILNHLNKDKHES